MLTQYRLLLGCPEDTPPHVEWGYRLYAALLERTSPEFGASLHRDGTTPVSQFVSLRPEGIVWTVNLLGAGSEYALAPALDSAEGFTLDRGRLFLPVLDRRRVTVPDAETLLRQAAESGPFHTLTIRTATAFKSQGRYLSLPTERLLVQSLMKRWNGAIPECPIEDEDGAGMDALAAGIRFRNFHLRDSGYFLKGRRIPGFVGALTLENRLSGFHRQIAGALLIFSGFAGLGIKTALGMGGVEARQGLPEN